MWIRLRPGPHGSDWSTTAVTTEEELVCVVRLFAVISSQVHHTESSLLIKNPADPLLPMPPKPMLPRRGSIRNGMEPPRRQVFAYSFLWGTLFSELILACQRRWCGASLLQYHKHKHSNSLVCEYYICTVLIKVKVVGVCKAS